MSLEDQLATIRAAGAKRMPEEARAIMAKATADLRQSGIMDGTIKVGDKLPDFALPNAAGQQVTSQNLLERGAVVLTVFRGHW